MMWLRGTKRTTVVVNDTIHKLYLYEETNGDLKKLGELIPKSQMRRINDEPTGESNFVIVNITQDESYKVLVRKRHQPRTSTYILRAELITYPQIIIVYDEEQGSLHWRGGGDIPGTMDSKRHDEKKQKSNDRNGEHPAKQAAKDGVPSLRETGDQLLLGLTNSQHMSPRSKRGYQESIEQKSPKNVTPREHQEKKKRKIYSNTFDLRGATNSKGASEKECKPNDRDGEHPTKRTKANDYNDDVKPRPYKT